MLLDLFFQNARTLPAFLSVDGKKKKLEKIQINFVKDILKRKFQEDKEASRKTKNAKEMRDK